MVYVVRPYYIIVHYYRSISIRLSNTVYGICSKAIFQHSINTAQIVVTTIKQQFSPLLFWNTNKSDDLYCKIPTKDKRWWSLTNTRQVVMSLRHKPRTQDSVDYWIPWLTLTQQSNRVYKSPCILCPENHAHTGLFKVHRWWNNDIFLKIKQNFAGQKK